MKKQNMDSHFVNSEPCQAWRGIRCIASRATNHSSSSLAQAELLNHFFGSNEKDRSVTDISIAPTLNTTCQVLPIQHTLTLKCQSTEIIWPKWQSWMGSQRQGCRGSSGIHRYLQPILVKSALRLPACRQPP